MNNSSTQTIRLQCEVKYADKDLLLELLKNAKVSVGHLSGRKLYVPGYSGYITFSKFVSRIESVYQDNLKPMYDKEKQYEKEIFFKSQLSFNQAIDSILCPKIIFMLYNEACARFNTPLPKLSESETEEIEKTLQWRKDIDAGLNALIENSQTEIDLLAVESCNWKIIKSWDSCLNTSMVCKNIHVNDAKMLKAMGKTSIKPVALKQARKDTSKNTPVDTSEIISNAGLRIAHR